MEHALGVGHRPEISIAASGKLVVALRTLWQEAALNMYVNGGAAALGFWLWFVALPAAEAGDRLYQRFTRRVRRQSSSNETVISLKDLELAKRYVVHPLGHCSSRFTVWQLSEQTRRAQA